MSDIKFEKDFLQGQRDCRDGVAHKNKSDAYNRGYATQYASEQAETWNAARRDKRYGH